MSNMSNISIKNLKFSKLKFIVSIAVALTFFGCDVREKNQSNSGNLSLERVVESSNEVGLDDYFEMPNFPLSSCGDDIPEEDYPISFYPVFIEYSEENMGVIMSEFCEDAVVVARRDSIQVASFTSKDKAEWFSKIMASHFSGSDVGEPSIIGEALDQSNIESENNISNHLRYKAISEKTRLSQVQINKLVALEQESCDEPHHLSGIKSSGVVIANYIPQGFHVSKFTAEIDDFGCSYFINYENPEGVCFAFGEAGSRGDQAVRFDVLEIISSSGLGRIELTHVDGDRINGSSIGFETVIDQYGRSRPELAYGRQPELTFDGKYEFVFVSGNFQSCIPLDLEEAVKIVSSLQLLNP